jgi:hypothetical protein
LADDIDRWFVRRLSLVIDNDQGAYNAVHTAAKEALESVTTRAEYIERFDADEKSYYAQKVGEAVADVIAEWIDETVPEGFVKLLIDDAIPLQFSDFQYEIGMYYLPDPHDEEEWLPRECE